MFSALKQYKVLNGTFGYQLLREVGTKLQEECELPTGYAKISRLQVIYGLVVELYNKVSLEPWPKPTHDVYFCESQKIVPKSFQIFKKFCRLQKSDKFESW